MKTLAEIQSEVHRLAETVGASPGGLPTFGYTCDAAHPHIEVTDDEYHFVVVERGKEIERRSTPDHRELLFWIFDDVTFQLAVDHELAHRIDHQDCRRLIFARQLELMARLGPDFAAASSAKIADTLARHPFVDEPR
jgi:hypothetical protein